MVCCLVVVKVEKWEQIAVVLKVALKVGQMDVVLAVDLDAIMVAKMVQRSVALMVDHLVGW